jgi:cytoskeletal protein CcmA (bactofilin family)
VARSAPGGRLPEGGAGSSSPAALSSSRLSVVVARGHRFEGLLTFNGVAQVDGELSGEVISRGVLVLGEAAQVRARIQADEVIVAGQLVGDITARRRIELLATARVEGRLQAPRVALADGCLVQGRCVTETSPAEGAEPSKAPETPPSP